MANFRTVLFNGYQRADVDGYVEKLMEELSALQTEKDKIAEEKRRMEETFQEKLKKEQEERFRMQKELELARQQISEYKERISLKSGQEMQRLEKLEQQLKNYERNYTVLARVLVDSKAEAEKIISDAKAEASVISDMAQKKAGEIEDAAKLDAAGYMQQAEEEIKKRREEESSNFEHAKRSLEEYLNSLNRSQSSLIEVYNDLGILIKKMPLRIEDIFSKEPFCLLEEEQTDGESSGDQEQTAEIQPS